MRNLLKVIVIFLAIVTSIKRAYAVDAAKILKISVSSGSVGGGYIEFSDNVTSKDCGGPGSYRLLAFETNSPGGKALYSMALTAYTTGKTVYVTRKNNCASWQGNVQEIDAMMIQP